MILHTPLDLDKVSTERVELVPTKKFFKPVLVITAPVTVEDTKLLGAEWVFTDRGLPRDIDGSIKLKGELPQAKVYLKGATIDRMITSEKVAHVSFYISEKTGMRIRLRIHCPENDTMLEELLAFLSQLNKDGYHVTIKDAQTSLIEMPAGKDDPEFKFPEPDLHGMYNEKAATVRPFVASNKKLRCRLMTLMVPEGFIWGWNVDATAMKDAGVKTGGRDLTTNNPTYPVESEARERAAAEAMVFINSETFHASGKAEEKAVEELRDYLIDLAPSLAHSGDSDAA